MFLFEDLFRFSFKKINFLCLPTLDAVSIVTAINFDQMQLHFWTEAIHSTTSITLIDIRH